MKAETIQVYMKPTRAARVHRMLFDKDLPFRGRREAVKNVYKRREKHQKPLDIA